MHRLLLKILFTVIAFAPLAACGDGDDPVTGEKPGEPSATPVHRTVLVYMVADNTLGTNYGSDQDDLNEMIKGAKAGSLNGGRLLVYHNRPKTSSGNPPQMLEITKDGLKVIKTYPDDTSVYSVDPERIREVMSDMKTLAPAEDYGLVLWSHANGWLGGTDENDSRYRAFGDDRGYHITVQTLAKTLEDEHFSFVYFDCCLMGCVEVIYEMRDVAPIMVACPTELSIDGMPYDRNLPHMFSLDTDMEDAMVKAAENTYKYYEADENGYDDGCQIAVYDTRNLGELADASRDIFRTVTVIDPKASLIQSYNTSYSTKYIYDMDNLMEFFVRTSHPELLDAWREAWRKVVVYGHATRNGIGNLYIDRFCGLGTLAIDQKSDITWRGYNTLQWWKDVVSYAPAYN